MLNPGEGGGARMYFSDPWASFCPLLPRAMAAYIGIDHVVLLSVIFTFLAGVLLQNKGEFQGYGLMLTTRYL